MTRSSHEGFITSANATSFDNQISFDSGFTVLDGLNQIRIGTSDGNKTNPVVEITSPHTVNSENGRGVVVQTDINATGDIAYAGYDMASTMSGTANYDHIVGFQARPEMDGSGTLTRMAGFQTLFRADAGTITDVKHIRLTDPAGSGTVTNQYGLYVEDRLDKATNNWAIWTADGNEHRCGGNFDIIGHNANYGSFSVTRYNVLTGVGANFLGKKANGTEASPTAVISGNRIAFFGGQGYGDTGFKTCGALLVEAEDTFTDSSAPGAVVFSTVPSGSTTLTERVRIDNAGNVGIGGTANANAILDCQSTTKPFMPPRMTTTQRDNVSSPTAGMVIYNSTTNVLNFYNGSAWGAV